MAYYPSSQVKTNQYTNGNEFILDNNDYKGPYFTNSSGQVYTGKTPQDPNVRRLTPNKLNTESPTNIPTSGSGIAQQNSYYEANYQYIVAQGRSTFNPPTSAPVKPIQETVFPTDKDYSLGEFQRYFLKKSNEYEFIEVSKKQQNLYIDRSGKVQWSLYIPITISWILEGKIEEVYNTNKNIVELAEIQNNCLGFVKYFNNNFSQFYKNEGKVEKNKDMEGFHIMPDGTKMKDSDMPNYNTSTKISGGY